MAAKTTDPALDGLVQKLLIQTGITEAQALELISLVGLNWASLVREAKIIRNSLRPSGSSPGQ